MFSGNTLNDTVLLIQAVFLPVSIIGVIVTLFWQQKIAKRRATLDMILTEQSDSFLLKQRRIFSNLRAAGNVTQYALPKSSNSEKALSIKSILNLNELIAIGIAEKTMDARLYKKYCRTEYVHDWIGRKPFVMELRRQGGNPTYYCEIESLAKKWANTAEQTRI